MKKFPDQNLKRFLLFPFLFRSVQSLSCVRLFATPWIAARQACLSITNSQSSLRLTSIKLVMPSSHLILCRLLLLLAPIPPSIRVFSNESTLHTRWLKYWSFSFSIILFKEHPGLISFRMDSTHTKKWIQWQILFSWVPKSLRMVTASQEIKSGLFLGRKAMTNQDSVLKSRDITLLTKICTVKAMFFPVVMHECKSWS